MLTGKGSLQSLLYHCDLTQPHSSDNRGSSAFIKIKHTITEAINLKQNKQKLDMCDNSMNTTSTMLSDI